MQTPKSLLVHLDDSPEAPIRARIAGRLTERFDAHGTAYYAVTPSILRFPFAPDVGGFAAEMLATSDDEQRAAVRARFDEIARVHPRLHWAQAPETAWDLRREAFYTDLLILGQRNPEQPSGSVPADLVSSMILETGRPTLVLPYIWTEEMIGRTVLIAWKESREATRALSAALPWLRDAERVEVVSFGEAENAGRALGDLKAWLGLHGLDCNLHHGGPQDAEAGIKLLSMSFDLGADLMVMGCYGHSRAREWALGGASRTVLTGMTLPVLMVH